jgi:FkbM family methyltransferase
VIERLPPGVIRFGGRLEHALPFLSPAIRRTVHSRQVSDGVIAHGEGKGLRFNPGGANPGYVLGTTEPGVQQALVELLEPGMTFYDIGANMGFFSLIAWRRVGPGGRVRAFEPLPESARTLRHNVALNDARNVEVVEAAVGAEPGRAQLAVTAESVQAHLADIDIDTPTLGVVDIEVTAVDAEVAAGRPAPDVVKVDVEGAELAALDGMRETFHEHRPALLCELHGTAPEVCDFLEALGYRLDAIEQVESIRTHDGPLHLRAVGDER